MVKINRKAFNKICKKIDELVISKKRKAMKNPKYTISVIVFLKDKKIKFERVLVFNEMDKWLEIYYFDEDKNKKCKTKFRIDDPNFIGYIPKIEMKI